MTHLLLAHLRHCAMLLPFGLARLLAACPLVLPQDQRRLRLAAVRLAEELDGDG